MIRPRRDLSSKARRAPSSRGRPDRNMRGHLDRRKPALPDHRIWARLVRNRLRLQGPYRPVLQAQNNSLHLGLCKRDHRDRRKQPLPVRRSKAHRDLQARQAPKANGDPLGRKVLQVLLGRLCQHAANAAASSLSSGTASARCPWPRADE